MQADTGKTTRLLKKYLKQKYNIDARIASKKYSGGSSLSLDYTLGVDSKIIEDEVGRLQYGRFDGMQDLYEHANKDTVGMVLDGYQLETFRHVFIRQDFSDNFLYRLAQRASDDIKYSDIPELTSITELHKNFPKMHGGAWTWGEYVRTCFNVRNFVTQEESKIVLKSAHHSENGSWNIYFIYEVDGVEYSTEQLPALKTPVVKKLSMPEKNEIQIVDYSDKSFAVIGGTYEIKDKLKAAGGSYNKHLKCGAGWIFSLRHRDAVNNIVIDYYTETK